MKLGSMNEIVTIEIPSAPVADGALGFTQTWTPVAQRVPASVQTATSRDLERVVANTVESSASHLVATYFVPGVTTKGRVVWHDWPVDRTLAIVGVHADGYDKLQLACEEVVA